MADPYTFLEKRAVLIEHRSSAGQVIALGILVRQCSGTRQL